MLPISPAVGWLTWVSALSEGAWLTECFEVGTGDDAFVVSTSLSGKETHQTSHCRKRRLVSTHGRALFYLPLIISKVSLKDGWNSPKEPDTYTQEDRD